MIIGEFHHNIDDKNRLIIPSKFRDILEDSFILTRGIDPCLNIYSNAEFEKMIEEMDKLPKTNANARRYMHVISTRAVECSIDKQGRIAIPAYLAEDIGITKECAILGVKDHIEIWDLKTWNEYYKAANENFEQVAESLNEYLS
jgi:MraZ protein